MPLRSKRPRLRLSLANSRSPCSTWMVTLVWLSAAVLNTSFLLVGMVVFFSISLVITPPSVSTPSESGVTSSSSTSFTSPCSTAPWMAAPTATTSSGLMLLSSSVVWKMSFASCCTLGMRMEPPTSTTSCTSFGFSLASRSACSQGPRRRSNRSLHRSSKRERVTVTCRCLGPFWSAVMKGRLTAVSIWLESSILAFSAASFSRCSAIASLRMSMPSFLRNSSAMKSISRWSKSSPPRWPSPLVLSTSNTPSPTSRMLTSKVPPPRSNTAMRAFFFFSRP